MLVVSFLKKTLKWIVVAFFASTILSVVAFRFLPVPVSPLMLIRCTEQMKAGKEVKMAHHWIPIERMPEAMPLALIASEDANFMEHHGFDFKAIEDAAKHNREHPNRRKHGASTISQQTAKNVFLWPDRSWVRKGLEVYFTVLIELFWSKERILEVYLNTVEMGNGIYGVEAVAREHFNTSAEKLSRKECALIVATLPNPRQFSSKHPSAYMKKRQKQILQGMNYLETINKQKEKQKK